MPDNAQKTPLARSINRFAEEKILDAMQILGKALPCSVVAVAGQIVTVNFDLDAQPFTFPNVRMPIATWVYDWIPVQIGDKGVTIPSDVYLGGVSGLGGGVANLTQQANLSSLVFLPVGNAAWRPPGTAPNGPINSNVRVVQGPEGVLIRDMQGKCTIAVSFTGGRNGGITITTNNLPITINDGQTKLEMKGNGLNTLTGQSITLNMSSQVNVYAPDIVLAKDANAIALPLRRSNGSLTENVTAS